MYWSATTTTSTQCIYFPKMPTIISTCLLPACNILPKPRLCPEWGWLTERCLRNWVDIFSRILTCHWDCCSSVKPNVTKKGAPVEQPDISLGAALHAVLDVESFYLKHLPSKCESHTMLQKLHRELHDIYSKTYKQLDICHFLKIISLSLF
jgi:hypothetical protein